jgi:uncharacterized protein (DUF58 family)
MNLTWGAITALVLAALVGILAQWSGSAPAALRWRAIVVGVAVGLVYELFVTRNLRIGASWRGVPRLTLGRAEALMLDVRNGTQRNLAVEFLPVLPEGTEGDNATSSVALAPGGAAACSVAVQPLKLGSKRWPPLPVRIKGPLKLAWWSRSLPLASEMPVIPDTLGPREAIVASTDFGSSPQATIGSGHELHHLREYRAGDPRHMIDWKATARASRLITRVFSEDQHLDVMLLIDAGRTSRTQIDGMPQLSHYVNLAARFAEYCVGSDDQVGLVVFADRPLASLRPTRGVAAVRRVRDVLTGLEPKAVESDFVGAALHLRSLERHRSLVVLLTDLYEPSASGQLAQATRLLVPKHLPLIVGLLSEDVVTLSDQPGEGWLDPYRSFAAREYRRAVNHNIARLTRLGAHALVARPQELDRKVFATYALLRAQRRI